MFINTRIDKQIMIYLHNETIPRNQKNKIKRKPDLCNINESENDNILVKKSDTKEHILHDFTHIKFNKSKATIL